MARSRWSKVVPGQHFKQPGKVARRPVKRPDMSSKRLAKCQLCSRYSVDKICIECKSRIKESRKLQKIEQVTVNPSEGLAKEREMLDRLERIINKR